MIKETTIDRIYDLSLADVIAKYCPDLKKKGANFMAKSPFTEEKTPSFSVSPAKNAWKCFSTGKGGGNAVSFVMQLKNLSYPEAVREIADLFNIEIEYDNDEKGIERMKVRSIQNELADVNQKAWDFFRNNLQKIDEKTLRLTYDEAERLGIGFADDNFKSLYNYMIEEGVGKTAMLQAGLITETDKGVFDFFNGRVMFPIFNEHKQLCGFSGRRIDGEKQMKYLNTKDTTLFKKERLFLGMENAIEHIRKTGEATIVEGNYDVSAMFLNELENTVAPCGTAITESHIQLLKKLQANSALLAMDGDSAGTKATMRMIPLLVKEGIFPRLAPMAAGQDPYDFFYNWEPTEENPNTAKEWIAQFEEDGIEWYAAQLFADTSTTVKQARAENELEQFLSLIADTKVRKNYVKKFAKKYNLSAAEVEKNVNRVLKSDDEEETSNKKTYKLPPYISDDEREEFDKRGFFEDPSEKNMGYWFQAQYWQLEQVSNFLIKPLFHVDSFSNNRRLVEIKNKSNGSFIIEVPSKGFVSVTPFQEACMEKGNFHWFGNNKQFKLVAVKFMDKMPKAKEITILGWQHDGFFAFADGIVLNERFKKVDTYGMVTATSEHDHYFLPAFSTIYKNQTAEDDPYQSDRLLEFRPAKISFSDWAELFFKVHGKKNSIFSIAFLMASLFRDLIYIRTSFFPILFKFGDVQTGKTQAARSLNSVLLGNSQAFMLNSGTLFAFTKKLGQYRNVPVWMDEYTNDIDEKMFQGLKAVWDGAGREKGRQDNKTKTDNVYSSLILSGQYVPTRDSNSLYTRSIILTYDVKAEDRTVDEIEGFNKLVQVQSKGLSSIVLEVLKYRELIEECYNDESFRIMREMKLRFQQKEMDYNGRVLGNYVVLLTIVSLLEKKIKLPFTYAQMMNETFTFVAKQSEAISESDVLATYWKMVEFLFLTGKIQFGEDYDIQVKQSSCLLYTDGKKSERVDFPKDRTLLFLQFKRIHPEYMEAHKKQYGQNGVNETSIKSYMRSAKSFVGTCPVHQFEKQRNSAYVFDYDMLREQGVNLQVSMDQAAAKKEPQATNDMPF
jgi:DNA primase catalytic core